MCEDLALVAALSAAARQARTCAARAWAVYGLASRSSQPLEPWAYAELLRIPLDRITVLLAALVEREVITVEGGLCERWRDDRDIYRDSVTDRDVTLTVTAEEHRRTVDRMRQQRWRGQKKVNDAARLAALDAAASPAPIAPLNESVTSRVTGPLEEERIFSLSSQGARDPTVVKREQLMNKAHEEARRRLTPAQYAALIKQTTEPPGRYERYLQRGTSAFPKPTREFYEAIFKQLRLRREEGARDIRTEPQFPLPMTFKRTG